jgi:hypothetical protein
MKNFPPLKSPRRRKEWENIETSEPAERIESVEKAMDDDHG